MRVIFMGTPEFAAPVLERLIQSQFEVVAVYTQPDRVAGRGRSSVQSPIKRLSISYQLPVLQPANLKKKEVLDQLAGYNPDVIVVAAFGQILPKSLLDIPPYGCLNIHPSLLPSFRGASPVAAAILAGSDFTGISVMKMDAGLDTGDILTQAQIQISDRDTTGSLSAKLSMIAPQLLLEVLPGWLRGEITPRPQDDALSSYSGEFSKKDGEIDWNQPAIDIWRQVRAFQPWPGCYTGWQGKQLKIIEAIPVIEQSPVKAGTVVEMGKAGTTLGVNTGDGVLGILQVQLEGKRAMSAADFLRGQRQLIGVVLSSN